MKTKLMMVLLMTVFTLGATAQNRQQREKKEFPSKELITQLSLNDEQVTALKENETKYETALKELRNNRNDREKMLKNLKAIRTERLAGIKKILNAEQYVSYLEYEVINPAGGMMMGSRNGNQNGQRPPRNNFGGNDNFGGGDFGNGDM